MGVIAGIDEAGYGPILGPLVVTSVALSLPEAPNGADFWGILAEAVSRRAARGDVRVAVADSKALKRRGSIGPIETSVLAFLRAAEADCSSLREMMASLGAACEDTWQAYPWYQGRNVALPRDADPDRVARSADHLKRVMDARAVTWVDARCDPMHVGEFNEIVSTSRNKSMTTATRVMGLLERLWDRHATGGLRAVVDKQGGRDHYRTWLAASFWGCRVRTDEESGQASAYELSDARRHMKVSFEAKADDRHFAVALASMVSKYVRELFMGLFNDYWRDRVTGLAPTAGYYVDGHRFLSEIAHELQASPGLAAMMVRSR